MRLSGLLLRMSGWKCRITVPDTPRCVICVAPHTSNWDFILGLFAYDSIGRRANFLMKESWFVFPLKYLFRALGGIPVPKERGSKLTERITAMFRSRQRLQLAITPEGTRSLNTRWRKGFLFIASDAGVPVELGIIDYRRKEVIIADTYIPTGNIARDMDFIRSYYSRYTDAARYTDKFALPD